MEELFETVPKLPRARAIDRRGEFAKARQVYFLDQRGSVIALRQAKGPFGRFFSGPRFTSLRDAPSASSQWRTPSELAMVMTR